MFIPPYFPEPIVVPNNAADADYGVRLKFIRQVVAMHAATVALAFTAAITSPFSPPIPMLLTALIACFAGHSLLRLIFNGKPPEKWFSGTLALFTACTLGMLGRAIHPEVPLIAIPLSVTGSLVYTVLAGRDFSFVGQFILASLFAVAGGVGLNIWRSDLIPNPSLAAAISLAYLAYYTYDLAMIMKRRRPDEQVCAATDLYGDVLNCFSYTVRALRHWRLFKI